jgi:putative redox protein
METNTVTLKLPIAAQINNLPHPHVEVRGTGRDFVQKIRAGNHCFQSDEPFSFGGTDLAPDPHDYLMASLGACTSMMIGLQARKRAWPLEKIHVSLRHSRIPARECDECVTERGMIDRIEVAVELTGPLTPEQRGELMKTAATCPIHRALKGEINISLRAEDG